MSHKKDDDVPVTGPDDTGGLRGGRGGTAEDPTRPGDVGTGGYTDTDYDGDGRPDSTTDGGD